MPGKCIFRDDWVLTDPEVAKWLRPVTGEKYKGFCTLCKSKFDVSHSGFASVKLHIKGKRHQELAAAAAALNKSQTVLNFKQCQFASFTNQASSPSNPQLPDAKSDMPSCSTTVATSSASNANLNSFVINESVIKAEVIWAINKVMCHTSSRSATKSSDLFASMFPDSIIAQNFKMQKDKASYILTYGIGPYFQDKLCQELYKCSYYCVSLDESMNKISQKGQMDIVVRFWDSSANHVQVRYLSSAFLGHSTASALLDAFTGIMSEMGLSLKKILQISTDGPNVNLKFMRDFQLLMKSKESSGDTQLIDIGTCSLHIIHNAYKTAHDKSKWNLHSFLRSLYFLFKDFPSRRADYTFFSGSSLFPLKFCSIRWIENSSVLERAVKIYPFVQKYVNELKCNPPASNNFHVIKKFVSDDVLPAKLLFLQSVALELEPFLKKFQSNKPLLPFLYTEIYLIMHNIANRFLKNQVLSPVKNANQLFSLDVHKEENQLHFKLVDVGFGAVAACKKLKESDVFPFKKECKSFLIALYSKLLAKLPLRNRMVRGASCLAPSIMLSNKIKTFRISLALEEFLAKNYISGVEADGIKKTYHTICCDPQVKEKLKYFNWDKHSLDVLFAETLCNTHLNISEIDMKNFSSFCQKIFVMFHGNAEVERGFSVNKECLVENLHEQSLISQRCVYSAVKNAGDILNIDISKSLITAVRGSSAKRREALGNKKKQEEQKAHEVKCALEKVKDLKCMKKKLMLQSKQEMQAIEMEIAETQKKIKKN